MGYLYQKIQPTRSIKGMSLPNNGRLARELKSLGGPINVVSNFPWTFSPSPPGGRARDDTPFIELVEYYQTQSSLQQQLLPYGINYNSNGGFDDLLNLGNLTLTQDLQDTTRLYEGVFDLTVPTGFAYYFPHFSQENFTISSSWEKKDILDTIVSYQKLFGGKIGKLGSKGAALARELMMKGLKRKASGTDVSNSTGDPLLAQLPELIRELNILKLQSNNPAVGLFDPPHVFRTSAQREYQVRFYLYNTAQYGDSLNYTVLRNWELCYILSYQNSVNKRNFFTGLPPVYYRVRIPGVHFSKASFIKSLNISNVGNVRVMSLPIDDGPATDVNVPDAYLIDITLQDAFVPSKNLYSAVASLEAERIVSEPLQRGD